MKEYIYFNAIAIAHTSMSITAKMDRTPPL